MSRPRPSPAQLPPDIAAKGESGASERPRKNGAGGPPVARDTAEKSLSSFCRALTLAPDFIRIYPTVVLAGTALAERYAAGTYRPLMLPQAVTLCKVMLHRALLAGVPVIRMGLQPTGELERPGTVIAGPYHPAFRQMVEAELRYDLLERLVAEHCHGAPGVEVFCAPSRISDVTGQRRANLARLLRERGVRITGVSGDPLLSSLDMAVAGSGGIRTGNILSDLHYTQKDITYA